MATKKTGNKAIVLGAKDYVLGCAACGTTGRWRIHFTAIAGTVTVKACIASTGDTAIAALVVYPIGSTTSASTITATGIYDIESSGLDITLSSDTSGTFSVIGVIG